MSLNQFETDEQRAEALLDWLKRNSTYLVFLVVMVIGSIFGVEYYKGQKKQKIATEYQTYAAFVDALEAGNIQQIEDASALFAQDNQTYKTFGTLLLAKQAHEADNFAEAETLLQEALKEEKDAGLASLLAYRLANVQFDQDNFDGALATLKSIDAVEFRGLVKTLEGDIFVAQGKLADAKISYEEALLADVVPENAAQKLATLSNVTE